MKRNCKRIEFVCKRCGEKFLATVCVSGLCLVCRKIPPGEAPLCCCGCGQKTVWNGSIKSGHWNKYIRGHHIKDPAIGNPRLKSDSEPWNKGHREYTFICANPNCGKEVHTSSKEKKFCSRKCSDEMKIGKEPWHKGKTKETDERLIVLGRAVATSRLIKPTHNKGKTKENYEPLIRAGRNISVVLKEKFESGELTNWNNGLTKETDERMIEFSRSISLSRAKQIGNGVNIPRWYKYSRVGWFFNCFTCEKEIFRSSYEAAYMNYLNKNNIKWTTKHGILVDWKDRDGYPHKYVPDFMVWLDNDIFEIHEVKAEWMKCKDENQRKFYAAILKGWRTGWHFQVLTEKDHPEFEKFNPSSSEWFIDYDEKTKKILNL